ncbi:39911_t:CDS:2, partial [Gigaspora margarita]
MSMNNDDGSNKITNIITTLLDEIYECEYNDDRSLVITLEALTLPSYTDEFGLIYEYCNSGNNDKDISICGFHIHKEKWDKFFDNPSKINPYDRELSICPYFNFTFCVFFGKWNNYQKSHFPLPLCFCERPVILRNTWTNKPIKPSFQKSKYCIHLAENHIPRNFTTHISPLKFIAQVADDASKKEQNILYSRLLSEIRKRQSCQQKVMELQELYYKAKEENERIKHQVVENRNSDKIGSENLKCK